MQAYAYVSAQVGSDFDGYARDCGLTSKSELLKLLIERELRLHRLGRSEPQASFASVARDSKITTHLPPQLSDRFAAHISALGFSKSLAAALLVSRELDERWLAHAIEWEPAT